MVKKIKILQDLKAYSGKSKYPKGIFNILFYINVLYRLSHYFSSIKLLFVGKIFWMVNRIIFGVDIDPRAVIGGGLVIKHGMGIVIGAFTNIGVNCVVFQGVTIGGNKEKTRLFNGNILKQPLIGDNVIIGINALILGPIVLGSNCFVGAGSIILKDVAENSIVVGRNEVLSNISKK